MEQAPIRITTAARSGSEDRRVRQRRYAITQGVRMVCFILAVLLPVPVVVKLLLIAAALVLPWLGVVGANAGPSLERRASTDALLERPARIAIEPGRDIDA